MPPYFIAVKDTMFEVGACEGSIRLRKHSNEMASSRALLIDEDDSLLSDSETSTIASISPPTLKYSRLQLSVPSLFSLDPVSASWFGEACFIFATHSGTIHICKPDLSPVRTFKAHRALVLSLYSDGVYLASASMDGTVVIGSITDETDIFASDFQRPVHCVVLEPNFARTRGFFSGGMRGQLIHSRRNWLGKRSDTVLDSDNGPIVLILLVADLLLWMNDAGITVAHLPTRLVIDVLPCPQDALRADLYWPRTSFPESDRILVAWGYHVWLIRVSAAAKQQDVSAQNTFQRRVLPSTASISFMSVTGSAAQAPHVHVDRVLRMDLLVCGIASFAGDRWLVLTYDAPLDRLATVNPDLKIVNSFTGDTEWVEELEMRDLGHLGPNDYSLASHCPLIPGSAPQYYIVSARDVVIAQELQLQDRILWLALHDSYLEAWTLAGHIPEYTLQHRYNLATQHLDYLVASDQWEDAARFLTIALEPMSASDDAQVAAEWAQWATIFIKANHIPELTPHLPVEPLLPSTIYDSLLEYWLVIDITRAWLLVRQWPLQSYDHMALIDKCNSRISSAIEEKNPDSGGLRRILFVIYDQLQHYQESSAQLVAMDMPFAVFYMSYRQILGLSCGGALRSTVFNTLGKFNPPSIDEASQQWIRTAKELVHILLDSSADLSESLAIAEFDTFSTALFLYYYVTASRIQGNELLKLRLFCQYSPDFVLEFLQDEKNLYDGAAAITMCVQYKAYRGLVYLYGRLNEHHKALDVLVNIDPDPREAIQYARRQDSEECWTHLLKLLRTKQPFIEALIECSDEQTQRFYDPVALLPTGNYSSKASAGINGAIARFHAQHEVALLMNKLVLRSVRARAQLVSVHYRRLLLKGNEVDEKGHVVKL